MRGLPKAYIKKWGVTKLAWKKYRAKALSKSRSTRTKTTRRSVKRMGRRKKKRRGGKNTQATIFKLLRVGSIAAPGLIRYSEMTGSSWKRIGRTIMSYGGVELDGSWNSSLFARMWTPFVATCAATWGIPKLVGILRRL